MERQWTGKSYKALFQIVEAERIRQEALDALTADGLDEVAAECSDGIALNVWRAYVREGASALGIDDPIQAATAP